MTAKTVIDQAADELIDDMLDKIQAAAAEQGLSQSALAWEAEISPETVNRCLYARTRRPTGRVLFKLGVAMGVLPTVNPEGVKRERPAVKKPKRPAAVVRPAGKPMARQVAEKIGNLRPGETVCLRGVLDPITGEPVGADRVENIVRKHARGRGWAIETYSEDGALVVLRG